jgi:hypothetical protein
MPSASTAVFLFIDTPNMVVHGGGHALFGWFGATLGLSGGTILQWLVPLLLAVYFFPSAASCWVRFLPVLLFRELNLHRNLHGRRTDDGMPLATHGDPAFAKHDWNTIFTNLGVLQYDRLIAGIVRFLGWCKCWPALYGWAVVCENLNQHRIPRSKPKAFNRRDRRVTPSNTSITNPI